MKTTCPACGTKNAALRVGLYWTGLHIRCRSCREVYRLVETTGGMFAVFGAFGAVYLLAFWAWLDVPAPAEWGAGAGALWTAAIPAAPAALIAVLTAGWLHRMGPPPESEMPRLGPVAFGVVYLMATLATAAAVALIAFGILITRFGEEMPLPDFGVATEPVAVSKGESEQFVFVDLAGTPRSLAGLRGSVVFVHLFDPDDRRAPRVLETIRELRKTAMDDGVLFAVVAECTRDRLAMFVDSGAPALPYAWTDGPLPDAFRALGEGRPVTFVIDRGGDVVFRIAGVANWATDGARGFLTALARGG